MLSLAIAHRLVLVAERLDGQHRAERLVLDDRHRAVAAVEQRGQVVEAVGQRRVVGPAARRSAAWRPRRSRARRTASTFSRCAAEISGPVSAFVVERPAEPDQLGAADQLVDELVVDRLLDDQPGAGRAHLAGVQEHRGQREVQRGLAVGVGEHDVGVLAAELEGHLLHGRRGRGHDPLAGRPGRR